MEISEQDLEKQLLDCGNALLSPSTPRPSASQLLASLTGLENMLAGVEQSPSDSMKEALAPSTKALIAEELLRHSDDDVKVAVASCISEITRITAPDAPYADDPMKEVFQLIVSTFEKLDDTNSISYPRRTSILETVAKVRSCVVMLDLECDNLIVEMFRHFFRTVRNDHNDGVLSSMETIMILVVEESEDISVDLLSSILNALKKENKEAYPSAFELGEKVMVKCASKLKPYLLPTIRSIGASLDDYSKAVADTIQSGDESVEPTVGDAANRNSADGNDLVNAPPEKAVEVAMETLEDAPPSEEAGPSTVGSPKNVTSNGSLNKSNEETTAANDKPKEADHDTEDEKAEASKTIADSEADEEPPKPKSKPEKTNRRKGRKPNSTKSSSEPVEPLVSTKKVDTVNAPEHQEDDAKNVDDSESEDPVGDTVEAANDKKSSEVPVPSPKTSDSERVGASSPNPIESLADESRAEKGGRGKRKEHPVEEDDSASDVDSRKESDTKQDSEGAAGSESILNEHARKTSSSASDREESVPDSADDTKKEDDDLNELDSTSTKELANKAEVGGSQRSNKKKKGQAKATPAKGHAKTSAKDDKKKAVTSSKSTPKAAKDENDGEEALRSSSKRKRSGEGKAPQTKVYGKELVGKRVEVWWPDDKKFYKGRVESYDPSGRLHKVDYDDGDVEKLNFKKEKWNLIEGQESDDGSSDDSADETPKGKKAKTTVDLGTKRGKTLSSSKTSGASSSKVKGTPKSAAPNRKGDSKTAGKTKEDASKKGVKSDLDKSGKSKASKSGAKTSDDAPKSSRKSKDDDVDTPKGSTKSKQDTFKGGAKSKGKSTKSAGKSNVSASGKGKAKTSSLDEETEDESLEPESAPEKQKGKSQSAAKSQKSSNKRKRSGKD